jgi:hypothetical protein
MKLNAYQHETLNALIAAGDIQTARDNQLAIEIDADGTAWTEHAGHEIAYVPAKSGWVVIHNLEHDLKVGSTLDEARVRAALYALDDEENPRTPEDKLLTALVSSN